MNLLNFSLKVNLPDGVQFDLDNVLLDRLLGRIVISIAETTVSTVAPLALTDVEVKLDLFDDRGRVNRSLGMVKKTELQVQ